MCGDEHFLSIVLYKPLFEKNLLGVSFANFICPFEIAYENFESHLLTLKIKELSPDFSNEELKN